MRQFVTAVLVALPFLLAAVFMKRFRREAALMAAAILGWGLWAQLPAEVEEASAHRHPLLSASFLAFVSAGIATAMVGLFPWEKVASKGMRRFGRAGASAACAGLIAAAMFAVTRGVGSYPDGSGAIEIVFGAIGALHLGILAGLALAAVELFVEWRRERRTAAGW